LPEFLDDYPAVPGMVENNFRKFFPEIIEKTFDEKFLKNFIRIFLKKKRSGGIPGVPALSRNHVEHENYFTVFDLNDSPSKKMFMLSFFRSAERMDRIAKLVIFIRVGRQLPSGNCTNLQI
jgi:hypothetical protein